MWCGQEYLLLRYSLSDSLFDRVYLSFPPIFETRSHFVALAGLEFPKIPCFSIDRTGIKGGSMKCVYFDPGFSLQRLCPLIELISNKNSLVLTLEQVRA